MNSILQHILRRIKGISLWAVGAALMAFILLLLVQESWGDAVKIVCVFYTMATVLFLGAQAWGFVVSQTQYSESVENPKFDMLIQEEQQWIGYEDR